MSEMLSIPTNTGTSCCLLSAGLEGKPGTKANLTIFWDHLLKLWQNFLLSWKWHHKFIIYQLAFHSFAVSIRWELKVATISWDLQTLPVNIHDLISLWSVEISWEASWSHVQCMLIPNWVVRVRTLARDIATMVKILRVFLVQYYSTVGTIWYFPMLVFRSSSLSRDSNFVFVFTVSYFCFRNWERPCIQNFFKSTLIYTKLILFWSWWTEDKKEDLQSDDHNYTKTKQNTKWPVLSMRHACSEFW